MSESKFIILNKEIPKGHHAFLEMHVAKLHTGNLLDIPIIVDRAKEDGPVLLLMGGVHGDEDNGPAIVRDIIRKKLNKPKRGTVICIPVLNVFGYLSQTREFPDGRDLNRVFPGSERGSLASRFAHRFVTEIAPLVDYVLDFHTGGADRENYPNIRCVFNNQDQMDLAKIFGTPFIVNSKYIPKSIRFTLSKMGKTILLFEGGKSKEINQSVVEWGVRGALNVMKYLGMQEGEIEVNNTTTLIERSKWIRAPLSGMFQALVKNGSHVRHKDLLGRIYDPYGEFEKKVRAPYDCCIFGLNTAPIVYKGDALFNLGIKIKTNEAPK